MLETFGIQTDGKEYRRLVATFERVFGATIFFGPDALQGSLRVVQRSRFSFMREAQIWYSRELDQRPISGEFENVIMLSDDFYQEILAHSIPNDLEAFKLLGAAPAGLDLYVRVAQLPLLQVEGRRSNSDLRRVRVSQSTWVCGVQPTAAVSGHARPVAHRHPDHLAGVPRRSLVRRHHDANRRESRGSVYGLARR